MKSKQPASHTAQPQINVACVKELPAPGTISASIANLHQAAINLENALNSLASRLTPAVVPTPLAAIEPGPTDGLPPLAIEIDEQTLKLYQMTMLADALLRDLRL